ncbi:MAG: hypothetical protein AAF805_00990 [Planctomycetota bacterium]
MRSLLIALVVSLTAGAASAVPPQDFCWDCPGDGVSAARAAEITAIEARLFRQDAAARLRRLRNEIDYAEARVRSLRRQIDEYDRINRFGTGSALRLSAEQARLDLRREESFLRELRRQVIDQQRNSHRARRAYAQQLQALQTHAAWRASDAEPVIEIINH